MFKKLFDKFIIYTFEPYLINFKIIKVKGFGSFIVETKSGQRMGIYIPWYKGLI
jgi:hypothetical protein